MNCATAGRRGLVGPVPPADHGHVNSSRHLVVVGAGILGLTHALEAHRRGWRVTVVERDTRAVGASIRNFGHCVFTAQPDAEARVAATSREGWLRASADAGLGARGAGGIVVARTPAQARLVEEFAASRPDAVAPLTAEQVGERLRGDAGPGDLLGGADLTLDLRVDPRTTVGRLAEHLGRLGVEFRWRTAVLGVERGTGGDAAVATTRGGIAADHVVVCVGHDLDHLLPDVAESVDLRRCALQMALVDRPEGLRTHAAVLTATSMLRYEGMASLPGASAVRDELAADAPELLRMDANVMFAERPDGTLLVGDSHTYDLTVDPFCEEWISERLLAEVAAVLGVEGLRVRQRWQGVYAKSPDAGSHLRRRRDETVTVVTMTTGTGMTLSFGIAAETLDGLG